MRTAGIVDQFENIMIHVASYLKKKNAAKMDVSIKQCKSISRQAVSKLLTNILEWMTKSSEITK